MKLSNRARFAVAFIFAIVLVGSAVFAISNAYDDWDYDYANMYDLYAVITIPHGQAIQYIPETPQIPGYRFVHWSATPDGEAFDFDAQIYDEVTLYAVWASQEDYAYSPGYDGYEYGGYINYAPRYYSYDYVGYAPYYEPYTHEAYCYGSYYSYYLGYQGTLEIRFLWNRYHLSAYSYAANSFMVTFVANGGLIRPGNFTRRSDPVTDTVTPQDMPLIPTRGGFAFSQWNTEPDGSGLAFTGNTVMTGNITVYAQWGRSIRFHGNGVSLAVLPPDQNDPTSYIERVIPMARSVANTDGIAWPNDPTRIGWVFVGWYDTVELLGGTAFTAYSVITHNVYLFARWELAPLITVTFDPTLGEITPAFLADHGNVRWHVAGLNVNQTNSALLAANVPNPNTTNNFPTVEAPPGSGLIFVGWANAARTVMVSPFNTGQTVEAPPHAGIGLGANILTESITLYAVWAFQIAGLGAATGAGLSDGTPVNQIPNRVWVTSLGQALTIYQAGHTMGNISRPMRPDPVRSGMQFQYWRITAPASMYGQAFTQHTPVASNMTVQPVWTSNSLIAVTLDANGGIFTNGSPTFTVTLPSGSYGYRYTTQPLVGSATVTPEKAGHIFAGFYCTEGYLRAMEGDTRPIVADKTLTARWIPMVTLTFITDEATTPAENSVTRNSPQGYNIRTIQEIMWFIHDGRTFAPEQSVPGNPPGIGRYNLSWPDLTSIPYRVQSLSNVWQTVRNGYPGAGARINMHDVNTIFYENATLYPIWHIRATVHPNFQSVLPALPAGGIIHSHNLMGTTLGCRLGHYFRTPSGGHMLGILDMGSWERANIYNAGGIHPDVMGGWSFVGWNSQADGLGAWITEDTVMTDVPWLGAGQSILWEEWDAWINPPGRRNDIFAIWAPGVEFLPGVAPASSILHANRHRLVQPEDFGQPLGATWPPDPIWLNPYDPGGPHFIFRGWNTHANGSGMWYTQESNIYTSRAVHAIWATPVTFHPNGGTLAGHTTPNTTEVVAINRHVNQVIGGAMPEIPTRLGYRFLGWNTHPSGILNNTGQTYTRTGPYIPNPRLLYANWAPQTELEKNSDVPPGETVKEGDTVTYVLSIINRNAILIEDFEIVDELPSGVSFIPGTVTIGGNPAPSADYDYASGELRIRFSLPPAPHGACQHYEDHGYCDLSYGEYCHYCESYYLLLITFQAIVQPGTAGTDITNTARLYLDGEPENECDTTISVSIPFRFHKTGMGIYNQQYWFTGDPPVLNQAWLDNQLLDGAIFALYRYTGTTSPAAGLVPKAGWVRVEGTQTSSTNPANPMTFQLVAGVYYQLVELVSPVGYAPAFGQWRLVAHTRQVGTATETGFTITIQGGNYSMTPRFENPGNTGVVNYVTFGGLWYVGNRYKIELPHAGGLGVTPFYLGGLVMLLLAAVCGTVIYLKSKGRGKHLQDGSYPASV